MAVPALAWVYLVWSACSPPAVRQVAQVTLFSLMAFTFALNCDEGRTLGRARRERMAAFERDLRAGQPIYQLLARHSATLYPHTFGEGAIFHDWLEDCLRKLHRDGVGIFRSLQTDGASFQDVFLPLRPDGPEPADLVETPDGPALRLVVPGGRRFVCGIRLTYSTASGDEGPHVEIQVSW
jgi:hypothetical protein